MKFKTINTEYKSKYHNKGFFKNLYLKPFETTDNVDAPFYRVRFKIAYLDDEGVERIFELSEITFTNTHNPTFIRDENGDEIEIIEYLTNGGVYDKDRVVQFNLPSITQARLYFETDVNGHLQFKNTEHKQMAIDWSLSYIKLEGVPIGENFELDTSEEV